MKQESPRIIYDTIPIDKVAHILEKIIEISKSDPDAYFDVDCGGIYRPVLCFSRLETKEEIKIRLDIAKRSRLKNKKYKQDKEKHDRVLYEKLKKRFEVTV